MTVMNMSNNQNVNWKQIRAVVFDLDGTLVDSMGAFTEIAQRIIQETFSISVERAGEMYRSTSGLPFQFQLQTLFPNHPAIPQAVEQFETQKVKSYNDKPFYPDVVTCLPRLKALNLRLAVSSNNHHQNVQDKVKDYRSYFEMVLGYKPDCLKGKDHFDRILTHFELLPEQVLFMGDSLHDCRMAYENKMPFIGRIGTFSVSDFQETGLPYVLIENFFDLMGFWGKKSS